MNKNPVVPSAKLNVEDIEIALLLEGIYQRWGYDFRDYAPASMKRRVKRVVEIEETASVSALQDRILRDAACMRRFIDQVTVSTTSMFRDADFFLAFRQIVVPLLKALPTLRIWHVGCASGEEVYSMAILLHETGLLSRTTIYATDINQTSLDTAKSGIYPLDKMQQYTANYQAAGGLAAFSEYYQAGHGAVVMRADLSKSILWAHHNLVTDASFNEFNLILCRNVMIYFNRRLQERVHNLFYDSLSQNGLLVLGHQESLQLMLHEADYRALDFNEKIYQRRR